MAQGKRTLEEIIACYLETLIHLGIRPQKALLYGSRARGIVTEDSDIDLLVVSRDFAGLDLRQRAEILGRAAAKIMEPVEAKGYTPEEIDLDRLPRASFLRHILTRPETTEYRLTR
ncbi:MAG: nucleotidyltransferase domain-containing protein [Moorella sp. (in: Bacteria)]|nr:nucleotidyltransferase domain-containing protein [Moorella sp. (in: firmicutes)]